MQIICIMGRSGSGKSTIEKLFENIGYTRVISYTTREMRSGEENHVNYHFINREQFQSLIDNGHLIEWAEYNGNLYGLPKPVGSNKYVVVTETDGFKQLKQLYGDQVFGVYLDVPYEVIEERLNIRNNTPENIRKLRIKEDDTKFSEAVKIADAVVDGGLDVADVFNSVLKCAISWRDSI